MKKITAKLNFISLLIFTLLITSGCIDNSKNKLLCYEQNLEILKKEKIYSDILTSAIKTIPTIKNRYDREFLKDSYVKRWKLDDAVFLNTKRDKCALLILEQSADDLRLDAVHIVQGTFKDNKWNFSYSRLPDVPEIEFTIDKPSPQNNSFKTLSKEGRLFVLTAGTVKNSGCATDNKYWFNE